VSELTCTVVTRGHGRPRAAAPGFAMAHIPRPRPATESQGTRRRAERRRRVVS
jgi:hypothetical protein